MADCSRMTTVSCSNHHEALTDRLWDFMTSRHRVDFNLQWGSRSIGVHQLIVEVFLSPEKLGQCALDDRNNILYVFLEFLYKGTVTVPEEQLDHLLAIANELDFKMLADAVESTRSGSVPSCAPVATEVAIAMRKTVRTRNDQTRGKPALRRHKGPTVSASDDASESGDDEWKSPAKKANPDGRSLGRSGDGPTSAASESQPEDAYVRLEAECDSLVEELSVDHLPNTMVVETKGNDNSGAPGGRRKMVSRGSRRVMDGGKNGDESHLSKLQRQPLLKCDKCGYQIRCETRFLEHLTCHDPFVVSFVCDSCRQPFLCKDTLERHRCKRKVGTSSSTSGGGSNKSSKAADEAIMQARLERRNELTLKYECPHCDYKALKKSWFKVHLAKHDPNVSVFRCDTCNRPFLSPETLERHRLRHTTFKCPHCPTYETTKARCYSRHLFAAHQLNMRGETVRKIQCPDCEYSCQTESELKYHAIAKHSGTKPFKCHLCDFASGYKSDVPKHVKVAHLNIKRHMCEQCGYRTAIAFNLEQHKLSHTESRPYACEICGQTYKDRGSFRRHVRRHVNDDKPYVCHICGHPFNRRHNLQVHMKNVHKTVLDPDAFNADVDAVNSGGDD